MTGYGIGIVHVLVLITIIAHEANGVLPRACLLVVDIVFYLVDSNLRLLSRTGRYTTYSHIGLVADDNATSFVIVQHTEVVVGDIAAGFAIGILALIAQQEIAGRTIAPSVQQHTVVPRAIAQQQEVAGHVLLAFGPVVEHLQITAIGIGIRGSTGEFIVQLISRDYLHAQSVMFLVQLLQTFGLRLQLLGFRNDDDHICSLSSMMVLRGYLAHQGGLCPCLRQVRSSLGL